MLARQNLMQLGLHERVKVHQGQFDAVIPNLIKGYDAVFFDGFVPHLNVLQQLPSVGVSWIALSIKVHRYYAVFNLFTKQ